MEFIFEIIFEFYLELMLLVIPEEKTTNKKIRIFIGAVAIIMMLAVIAAFLFGLHLISKDNTLGGIAFITGAVVVSAVQIIAGFFLSSKEVENSFDKILK